MIDAVLHLNLYIYLFNTLDITCENKSDPNFRNLNTALTSRSQQGV